MIIFSVLTLQWLQKRAGEVEMEMIHLAILTAVKTIAIVVVVVVVRIAVVLSCNHACSCRIHPTGVFSSGSVVLLSA